MSDREAGKYVKSVAPRVAPIEGWAHAAGASFHPSHQTLITHVFERHLSIRMSSTRYATSRQKSCQQCSRAKARCDRNLQGCSRCARRNLLCTFSQGPASAKLHRRRDEQDDSQLYISPSTSNDFGVVDSGLLNSNRTSPDDHHRENRVQQYRPHADDGTLDGDLSVNATFDHPEHSYIIPPNLSQDSADKSEINLEKVDLVCPINANEISNRWLNQYVPLPGQAVKNYPTSITSLISKILHSYASVVIRGHGVPPFVHALQTTALTIRPPLSTCLSLARICEQQLPGASAVAIEVLQREMNKLYDRHKLCDDSTLLAIFQAYLIYAMIVFFRLDQEARQSLRQAMMNLQELACATSERGLVCSSEQHGVRPGWESWVIAESKRRTLYTMYLFDSILSARDSLPTFVGTELRGLPAPMSKTLWQASSRDQWQKLYNMHLSTWTDGFFSIDELWPADADLDTDLGRKTDRVDRWLENLDEFGTMLYAVTSCTHGT